MWTYLQNSTLKISDNNARASLFAWKKHGTGNEELQPVWPPNNGLQPEPIQSLRARIPTAGALSLKHSHAHVHPNKSRPARCSSWAIIVCLVQLHLKWQRPRAMGRIKDCVQSNTPRTSCQRGCTAFPFSPAPPHFPLFLCSYVRHKNILSSLLSYIKTLWFLLPYQSPLTALSSLQPIASACCCPGKLFSTLPRGVKVEAHWTVDEAGQKPVLCSLSFAFSQGQGMIFMPASRLRPLLAKRLPATAEEEEAHSCACMCVTKPWVPADWIRP